jgi:hypothetical protein
VVEFIQLVTKLRQGTPGSHNRHTRRRPQGAIDFYFSSNASFSYVIPKLSEMAGNSFSKSSCV